MFSCMHLSVYIETAEDMFPILLNYILIYNYLIK